MWFSVWETEKYIMASWAVVSRCRKLVAWNQFLRNVRCLGVEIPQTCSISNFDSDENSYVAPMSYATTQRGRWIPAFRRHILRPSSDKTSSSGIRENIFIYAGTNVTSHTSGTHCSTLSSCSDFSFSCMDSVTEYFLWGPSPFAGLPPSASTRGHIITICSLMGQAPH